MADGDRAIRVDVPQGLLARIGAEVPPCKEEYDARLMRFRRQFALIASVKYDEGQFEKEVNVLVVRITHEDLY